MLETVKEIICEFVDIDPECITEDSSLRNDLGATSFDLMNIAVFIEEKYKTNIPNHQLPLIKKVGDIVNILEKLQ